MPRDDRDPVTERARRTVQGYFAALQAADLERAVSFFTPDVTYSHPPYPEEGPTAPRHEVRGQAALLELFHHRGPRRSRARIDTFLAAGDRVMFAGLLLDDEDVPLASFVSVGELDATADQLRSYAAYVSVPPAGAQLPSS